MYKSNRIAILAAALGAACSDHGTSPAAIDLVPSAVPSGVRSSGIVASVTNAPVAPGGDVAGAATDVVINLDIDMDPAVPGRTLPAGRSIRVLLPLGFEFVDPVNFPLADVFSAASCVPGNLQCTTAVLLQGWPQHPILPVAPPPGPPNQYSLSYDDQAHAIVYTALQDIVPGVPLAGPGIKQLHLILNGFLNPRRPGFYTIRVEAETGPGGSLEVGSGEIQILPHPRPHIGVTSAFVTAQNTIYQMTSPGNPTPLPYDFLLWDSDGAPFTEVTIEQVGPEHALLRKGARVVGHVFIDAPPGADGQSIVSAGPSFAINAPVTGVPTARLTAMFTAGSLPGRYVLTFSLAGGDAVEMFVDVT